MNGVNAVGVHIVWEPAAATDARNENGLLGWHADLGKYLFHLRQDGVIAATWAPSDVLVTGKIFGLEDGKCCAHYGIVF